MLKIEKDFPMGEQIMNTISINSLDLADAGVFVRLRPDRNRQIDSSTMPISYSFPLTKIICDLKSSLKTFYLMILIIAQNEHTSIYHLDKIKLNWYI